MRVRRGSIPPPDLLWKGMGSHSRGYEMSLLPAESPRYEEMQQVVELFVQNVNPTQIAKRLGLRRVDVLNHIDEWKSSAAGMEVMKDRVETLIATMDEHYSTLIRKAYEIVDEVDTLAKSDKETMTRSQMLSQKKGALDLIAKLEKDRIDILQKSGLLEMDHLGDELAQMEEQKAAILSIFEEDGILCQHCKQKVMGRLAAVMGGGNVTVVGGDS